MEKRQQLVQYLESLLHGPKQVITVSQLMKQFDMSYGEVTTTVMEWMVVKDAKKTTVLSA